MDRIWRVFSELTAISVACSSGQKVHNDKNCQGPARAQQLVSVMQFVCFELCHAAAPYRPLVSSLVADWRDMAETPFAGSAKSDGNELSERPGLLFPRLWPLPPLHTIKRLGRRKSAQHSLTYFA
jgi:hypothetical protein